MNPSASHPLLLVGCGNMGRALIEGWCRSILSPESVVIVEKRPLRPDDISVRLGIAVLPSIGDAASLTPSVIVIAVKPDALAALLPELRRLFTDFNPLIVSIAAGKNLSFYEEALWEGCAVIRLMPNTPCLIAEGMTGGIANAYTQSAQCDMISQWMQAVGAMLWLEDEPAMHALTATSGSGPAYCLLLMQHCVDAAMALGFSKRDATLLVTQTFLGAAKLAQSSHDSMIQLRQNVTSPGGTTAAGLAVLDQPQLASIIRDTLRAAHDRSMTLENPS